MKPIFIFSGLGTDERVFKYLEFFDCHPTFIKWIPLLKDETLKLYARRLAEQITAVKPVLVGLSFGGIVAIEVSKIIETEKIILIASAKSSKEIPLYFRIAGKFNLLQLLPLRLLKRQNFISNWFFGTETLGDKKLLGEILNDTDPTFLKWAISQIVKWDNQVIVPHVTHIHGTADRILPFRLVKADISIRDGGHFMTINKASEINSVLRNLL